MPTIHYAGRVIILAAVAALLLALGMTGALTRASLRAADCVTTVTQAIWAPLRAGADGQAAQPVESWRAACGLDDTNG